jgi:hypothetical protein
MKRDRFWLIVVPAVLEGAIVVGLLVLADRDLDEQKLSALRVGMTETEVIKILGPPKNPRQHHEPVVVVAAPAIIVEIGEPYVPFDSDPKSVTVYSSASWDRPSPGINVCFGEDGRLVHVMTFRRPSFFHRVSAWFKI